MADCVFCDQSKIASPIEKFEVQGRRFMVFEPLNPVTEGHLLVVPEQHVEDASVDHALSGRAMVVAAEVAARYESANIITSIGKPATQSVFHLHLHVVPRAEDDGLHLPWTGQH